MGSDGPQSADNYGDDAQDNFNSGDDYNDDYDDDQRINYTRSNHNKRNNFSNINQNINSYQDLQQRQQNSHQQSQNMRRSVNHFDKKNLDYLIIIDFEATCWEHKNNIVQEIIEFPLVFFNLHRNEIEENIQYQVKPKKNKNLSDYCKNLTGISQDNINNANYWDVVQSKVHDKIIEKLKNKNYVILTDGSFDLEYYFTNQMELYPQLKIHEQYKKYIDLKDFFKKKYKIKEMMKILGLNHVGNLHSGIDDCKNIARIMQEIIRKQKFDLQDQIKVNYMSGLGPNELMRGKHIKRNFINLSSSSKQNNQNYFLNQDAKNELNQWNDLLKKIR